MYGRRRFSLCTILSTKTIGKTALPRMDNLYLIPIVMTVVAALSIGAIYLISLLFKDSDEE